MRLLVIFRSVLYQLTDWGSCSNVSKSPEALKVERFISNWTKSQIKIFVTPLYTIKPNVRHADLFKQLKITCHYGFQIKLTFYLTQKHQNELHISKTFFCKFLIKLTLAVLYRRNG
jgi:hypothetical protein